MRAWSRAAEAGDDEHRAELVAIEPGRVRFVVQSRPAHVHGGRVLDGAFLFGVAVEARHRAQPTCDRRPCLASRLEVTGERLDVSTTSVEEAEAALGAVVGVLAEVEGVRLERLARVAGQEPGERVPLQLGKRLRHDDRGHEHGARNRHDGLQSEKG